MKTKDDVTLRTESSGSNGPLIGVETPTIDLPEGHDASCYYCGGLCNNLAGNPSLWSLGFTHADEPGKVKWHHVGCVQQRLRGMEKIKAALHLPQVATVEETVAEIERLKEGYSAAFRHADAVARMLEKRISRIPGNSGGGVATALLSVVPEPAGDFCTHGEEDFSHGCRRRAGHSGPHSFSLNESRALDAVVTHEDLRKLKAEILDEFARSDKGKD